MGGEGQELDPILQRIPDDDMGIAVPLFTGDKEVPVEFDWSTDPYLLVRQDLPLPFTVVAIMVDFGGKEIDRGATGNVRPRRGGR